MNKINYFLPTSSANFEKIQNLKRLRMQNILTICVLAPFFQLKSFDHNLKKQLIHLSFRNFGFNKSLILISSKEDPAKGLIFC